MRTSIASAATFCLSADPANPAPRQGSLFRPPSRSRNNRGAQLRATRSTVTQRSSINPPPAGSKPTTSSRPRSKVSPTPEMPEIEEGRALLAAFAQGCPPSLTVKQGEELPVASGFAPSIPNSVRFGRGDALDHYHEYGFLVTAASSAPGWNDRIGSIRDIRDGRTPQSSTIHQPSGSADCANSTPVKSIARVREILARRSLPQCVRALKCEHRSQLAQHRQASESAGFTMPQPVFDFVAGERNVPSRSHSPSLDQRRRPDTLRTAIAMAFFCPTSTTSRLPRVMPV